VSSIDSVCHRRFAVASLAWLLCIAATGCAPGRNSVKPSGTLLDPKMLDAGTAVSKAADAVTQTGAAPWWRAFGDQQLDELVDMAMDHNPSMDMAAARIRQAQAMFDAIHADTLPAVSGGASVAGERFSNNYGWGPYGGTWNTNNQILLGAQYSFDFWGKRRAQLAAEQDRVRAGQAEARDAGLLLQTAVVQTYIQFASAARMRDVTQRGLACREEMLRLAAVRQSAGLGDDMDIAAVRSAISETRRMLDELDGQIDRYRHALAALAGRDPAYADAMTTPTLATIADPVPITHLPADLLGYRPDVAAARDDVEAAAKDIEVAKAAFYPDIDLAMFAGAQRLGLNDFLTAGSFAAGVVPAVSLPIFDGGRLRSQLKGRTAQYDAAVADYNQVLLRALQQTADGVTDLQAAHRQYSDAVARVDAQHRLMMLQRNRAQAQLASRIDLLNADIAELLAQRDAIAAGAHVAMAQASLVRALGGAYTSHFSESRL
jgi:NodT family efflux transporter outer membrane factor (OMF) lipoprotein